MIHPRVLFTGDPAAATPWVGIAKKLARGCYDLKIASKIYRLGSGVKIRVENIFPVTGPLAGICKVWIEATHVGRYPYLSGLWEDAGLFAWQFYPARSTTEGIIRKWYQYSSSEDFLAWPTTPPLPEITDLENRFIVEDINPGVPAPLELPPFKKYPGQFTGKMRAVVQKLHGRRLSNPFHTDCGLFVPTNPDNRTRWIIDIRDNGVFTYPIRFVDESKYILDKDEKDAYELLTDKEKDRYDFGLAAGFSIPASEKLESMAAWAALSNEEREGCYIELMDDVSMEEIMDGKAPMSTWYATWAFDYTGHHACAVLIGEKEYNGEQLYYSYLYEITITEDGEGRPSSASVQIVDEDYLRTWVFATPPGTEPYCVLKAYVPSPPYLATGIMYDCPGDWHGEQPSPRDAPVYAFYNKDNERVVIRHVYKAVSYSDTEYVDPYGGPSYVRDIKPTDPFLPLSSTNPGTGMGIGSVYGLNAYNTDVVIDFGGYYIKVGSSVVLGNNTDPIVNKTYTTASANYTPYEYSVSGDGFDCGSVQSDGYLHCFQRVTHIPKRTRINGTIREYNFQSIALPNSEREGIFYYEHDRTIYDDVDRLIGTIFGHLEYSGAGVRKIFPNTYYDSFTTNSVVYMGTTYYAGQPPYETQLFLPPNRTSISSEYGITFTEYDNMRHVYLGGNTDSFINDLPLFDDEDGSIAEDYFDDVYQLYESANGFFSGKFMAAPYAPSTDFWEYNVNYPLDTSYAWEQSVGLMVYPSMTFFGDDETSAKLSQGRIDIEAVDYPDADDQQ